MPAGELWIVRIGQSLGDDALEVGFDDGLVERTSFADDAVGKRDPALGPLGDPGKPGLTVPQWQRLQIHARGCQQVEGDVGRRAMAEHELVEQRAPGVVVNDTLTIEHIALRQQIEHLLEALQSVAVARDQLATGCRPRRGSRRTWLRRASQDDRTAPAAGQD